MMRSVILALALVIAATSPAKAQSGGENIWVVGTEEDAAGNTAIEFVDIRRIEIDGVFRSAWQWYFFAPRHHSGVSKIILLNGYDCRNRRYRWLQSTTYPREGPEQTVPGEGSWTYAVPGSHEESVLAFVCYNAQQRQADERFFQLPPTGDMDSAAEFFLSR